MSHRTTIGILLALTTLVAAHAPATTRAAQPLIVHEWGTFTSLAGRDGRAVDWLPLDRQSDLPCFVHRLRFNVKSQLPAKIRMETPVLYFYAPNETTVNVNVRFHQGAVTEWFPSAAVTPASVDGSALRRPGFSSGITWSDVKIAPNAATDFPTERDASHYYAARRTDASPLQSSRQREKFLFYRGIGGFEPPITATLAAGGRVMVENRDGEPVGDAIVFENAGGMIAWQLLRGSGRQLVFDPLAGDGEIPPPHAELEQILIAHGLYAKEARAMIETWRDSWFDEGKRLFYIVSRKTIDSILPLEITPAPSEIVRVFVGRIELERRSSATTVLRDALSGCPR
jgi:hypothetical protein